MVCGAEGHLKAGADHVTQLGLHRGDDDWDHDGIIEACTFHGHDQLLLSNNLELGV